ncbi:MAG: hypothetical protein ACE15B_21755 [Bryobacteraceae bacterium]
MMRLAAALALAAGMLPAGDRQFDALVRGVESDYGVSRTRIPFFGVVNFFVKVARPAGTRDLRLAVFEDFSPGGDFTSRLESRLDPAWRPMVRVHSRRNGERTAIYVQMGKDLRLLIAAAERRETSLIQLRLNQRALLKWIEDPARRAWDRNRSTDR